MLELAFRDGIMERIKLREPRFGEGAYLFVLSGLEYCQAKLPERRHISGSELAVACRDLALKRYGLMARLVLDNWGVKTTEDIGAIVFTLVEMGLLLRSPSDDLSDFIGVYDFAGAFERDYPWGCAARS